MKRKEVTGVTLCTSRADYYVDTCESGIGNSFENLTLLVNTEYRDREVAMRIGREVHINGASPPLPEGFEVTMTESTLRYLVAALDKIP